MRSYINADNEFITSDDESLEIKIYSCQDDFIHSRTPLQSTKYSSIDKFNRNLSGLSEVDLPELIIDQGRAVSQADQACIKLMQSELSGELWRCLEDVILHLVDGKPIPQVTIDKIRNRVVNRSLWLKK